EQRATPVHLGELIDQIGFKLILEDSTDESVEQKEHAVRKMALRKLVWAAALTIPVILLSMVFTNVPGRNFIMMVLTLLVMVTSGRNFYVVAWKRARNFSANMDTLIAVGTLAAFIFSLVSTFWPGIFTQEGLSAHVYFETAAAIITLILFGKYLEERAKSQTSDAIRKLIGLSPKKARIIRNGKEQEVDIDQVLVGDEILIRPGEKIPVDGEVIDGRSNVDESMISGESMPVEKTTGTYAIGGTINKTGTFRMRASKVGSSTVLAQIIELVKEAQGSKAPSQRLADKISGIFVPVVIGISLLTFAIWYFVGPEPVLTHAFISAVTVLIIACPCALGLATPTAIMVGLGKGAGNGILIKDAASMEQLHAITDLVVDKTGTITFGKPLVTNQHWLDDSNNMRQKVVAVEKYSEHPLSEAVVHALDTADAPGYKVEGFESLTGSGLKALVENKEILIGKMALMDQEDISIPEEISRIARQWEEEARTVIFISYDKIFRGLLAVADEIKPSAEKAVQWLKENRVNVHMLTGDNQHTAQAIAAKAGISSVHAGALPADKAEFVKSLQARGRKVAMAGDGINDSPALAQADVGIAMGNGTDIAIESAQIALLNGELANFTRAVRLSKATVNTIKENLFWAFIYNIIGIPLAAGILYPFTGFLLNPMIAAAAMAFSSVSVVLNSLRLRTKRIG
ncbi:MAG TPA: copper-translocating P-type ATPase, partial [Bacteroidales bacterium]|nr:copper-translocating P-type ATPase [Bacteroidales bacterium]